MSSTNKRLEALERRTRKPDRVVDALRVLLSDEPPTEAEMAMILRCAQKSHAVRGLLDDANDDSQPT